MKVKISQPALNSARAALNQEGYTKDFEDFYAAGKALYDWPKTKMLTQTASQAQVDELLASVLEFDIDEAGLKILKKALKHHIDGKKAVTEYHFELFLALGIDPKTSLA